MDQRTGKGWQPITVAAPIEPCRCLFGLAHVPLAVAVQSAQQPQAIASVHVYPGADADFTLFSDDGTTYSYEKSGGSVTRLHWDEAAHRLTRGSTAWTESAVAVVGVAHP